MRLELVDLTHVVGSPGPRLKGNLLEFLPPGQRRDAGAPSAHWLARHRAHDGFAVGPARGWRRGRGRPSSSATAATASSLSGPGTAGSWFLSSPCTRGSLRLSAHT